MAKNPLSYTIVTLPRRNCLSFNPPPSPLDYHYHRRRRLPPIFHEINYYLREFHRSRSAVQFFLSFFFSLRSLPKINHSPSAVFVWKTTTAPIKSVPLPRHDRWIGHVNFIAWACGFSVSQPVANYVKLLNGIVIFLFSLSPSLSLGLCCRSKELPPVAYKPFKPIIESREKNTVVIVVTWRYGAAVTRATDGQRPGNSIRVFNPNKADIDHFSKAF